jgi:hypothetical protein
MKAIETEYRGYRFRSRLEARWAVFFDVLDIEWEYEPEGFDLGNAGYYLPDFYLRGLGTWIEIKPKGDPSGDAYEKMWAFDGRLIILAGTPGRIDGTWDDRHPYDGHVSGDFQYVWCECPGCGSIDIQFNGRAARNNHSNTCPVKLGTYLTGQFHPDKVYNYDSPRLQAAYKAARSARFERRQR